MTPEDAEEYTESLGQVFAGSWRQRALAVRLGVPQALGLTFDEWSEQRLGGYVRLSIPERREAATELRDEGLTQREIAGVLGVDAATVNRDLKPVASATDAVIGDEPEQVDDPWDIESVADATLPVGQDEADEILSQFDAGRAVPESIPQQRTPVGQDDIGNEWYTPRWLFDALGIKFSIDVCAPVDLTYSSVPAERQFNIDDDGLSQHWDGIVWCNPPYSRPEPWARRMIHHGDGLLLTHMPMNAGWCVDVWDACDGIRLFQAMEFVRPDGTSQRPGYWLQLAAFGTSATEALSRLQPMGDAAANKRRIASPMWTRG